LAARKMGAGAEAPWRSAMQSEAMRARLRTALILRCDNSFDRWKIALAEIVVLLAKKTFPPATRIPPV
jgi:hypothetical protein